MDIATGQQIKWLKLDPPLPAATLVCECITNYTPLTYYSEMGHAA